MTVVYAITIAAYLGCGLYMMLSRHVVRLVLGLSLLTNGAIFLIFVAGRVGTGLPAVIESGTETLPLDAANPLPQALALTAIVIGFALTAFAVALVVAAYRRLHTLDTHEMTAAEDMGNPFTPATAKPAAPGGDAALARPPAVHGPRVPSHG
jgi:multicomponent Na+:H+ antiporter subunit C